MVQKSCARCFVSNHRFLSEQVGFRVPASKRKQQLFVFLYTNNQIKTDMWKNWSGYHFILCGQDSKDSLGTVKMSGCGGAVSTAVAFWNRTCLRFGLELIVNVALMPEENLYMRDDSRGGLQMIYSEKVPQRPTGSQPEMLTGFSFDSKNLVHQIINKSLIWDEGHSLPSVNFWCWTLKHTATFLVGVQQGQRSPKICSNQ